MKPLLDKQNDAAEVTCRRLIGREGENVMYEICSGGRPMGHVS